LEDVQDYMRRGLIQKSTEFEFGHFTSIASVLVCLLKYNQMVTSSVQTCSEENHHVTTEANNRTFLITTLLAQGQSLQNYLNNFKLSLPSRCVTCARPQIRHTMFKHQPPLLAFEWSDNELPDLDEFITVVVNTTAATYILKGIIHYQDNHFTAHVNLSSGTWFHDGIVTGQSLILQQLQPHLMNTAIIAIYS
ncbi:hypothetical protein L208DRAFT_1322126, partial [Tricholoma matsutake]